MQPRCYDIRCSPEVHGTRGFAFHIQVDSGLLLIISTGRPPGLRSSPFEIVAGVLDDGGVAVGLVAAVRHVHVELARPRHKAMAHVFGHRLVLIQLA